MPCSTATYRTRIGAFQSVLIAILKKKSERTQVNRGKYTPFTRWDSCTDFSYRCFVTTLCVVSFLLAVKGVLSLAERDWFVHEMLDWMGGCVWQEKQSFSASGFLPPYTHSTDATVTADSTHAAFCCQSLLHRCGDVELNPGPPKQDSLRQTRLGSVNRRASTDRTTASESAAASVPSVTTVSGESVHDPTLRDVMSMLTAMNNKFDEMKTDMKDMRESFSHMKGEVADMKEKVNEL